MLVDLLWDWGHKANSWILELFHYIFPEYPQIGLAVFVTSAIFFIYYLFRSTVLTALKMSLSTLAFFSFLLFFVHALIKLYRVVL